MRAKQSLSWLAIGLVSTCVASSLSAGEPCELGPGPAATLLLPYFEVDVDNPDGITTLFSINNAADEPTLTNLTLWTDYGVPTIEFHLYLTGYDVATINLRDIFADGNIPLTADDQSDPLDTISPSPEFTDWDGSFPGCDGYFPFFNNPAIFPELRDNMVAAHTGQPAPLGSNEPMCFGHDHGDGLVRGYLTVDTARRCDVINPTMDGYFADDDSGVATNDNRLWGDYFLVDPANDFAHGDLLVHIEAYEGEFTDGDTTFYGSLHGGSTADAREPLPSAFGSRYLNGGSFDGGTHLIAWRDPGTAAREPVACDGKPAWFPLDTHQIVVFDEQENGYDTCAGCPICSPPGPPQPCVPLATQRLKLDGPVTAGSPIPLAFDFGWIFLDLDAEGDANGGGRQAWISTMHDASGRFSVGLSALPLNSTCDAPILPPLP